MRARRVELDYVARPRRAGWAGLAVLVLALAVAGELAVRYREAQQAMTRLEAESGLLLPERRAARALPRERVEEEAKSAEAVVRQLTLPWASLIGAIERAATRDVALLLLQPDAEQHVLRLSAEAKSREAMFDYLRRLAAAPGLADVHLVSHEVRRDDPQRPIQFTVQAALQ